MSIPDYIDRPLARATTVPLRVPWRLRMRGARFSWCLVGFVFVAVSTATAAAAHFIAMWIVGTGQVGP